MDGTPAPEAPRITVIVPCFNDGSLLPETLQSLTDQETLDVIVVDDASTDPHTVAVLDDLAANGVTVLHHESNRGLSAARMTGLGRARTPYVFPLDSDDLVAPRSLAVLADTLDAVPGAAVAFADYEEFGDFSRIVSVPARLDPFVIAYRNAYPVSALFRRDVLERVGGWRDVAGLVGYEDWHLWMTLAEAGEAGVHAGAGVVALRRRLHGTRMLSDAGRSHRELYGHLQTLHPRLFADRARHRRASDLPWARRAIYPWLYGARPPLGIGSRLRRLRGAAG